MVSELQIATVMVMLTTTAINMVMATNIPITTGMATAMDLTMTITHLHRNNKLPKRPVRFLTGRFLYIYSFVSVNAAASSNPQKYSRENNRKILVVKE